MSKRCELKSNYFNEFGNYKGQGQYTDDYVKWLEDKVISFSTFQLFLCDRKPEDPRCKKQCDNCKGVYNNYT